MHTCHTCNYSSSIFRRSGIDRTKKTKQKKQKEEKFWSRKKERNASWKRDQNLNETRLTTTGERRDINSSSSSSSSDIQRYAANATFNAPTCSQTHFTHTFIKYVCICSTTIHRVPRERRREICFVEETIEENSTMQFTRRGREEIGRGFKQK